MSVLPFDLMELFLPSGGNVSAGLLRIPKLIRLVRLMKLLKIVRASRILKRWEQQLVLKARCVRRYWCACFAALVVAAAGGGDARVSGLIFAM